MMSPHEKEYLPLLSALVDGELDDRTKEHLEQHLPSCELCSKALDDFQTIRSKSIERPNFQANPYFLTRLRATIEESRRPIHETSAVETKLFLPLLLALVVALALLFYVSDDEVSSTQDEYLYFGGQRTFLEQQVLTRDKPISRDEVLLLAVSATRGEGIRTP